MTLYNNFIGLDIGKCSFFAALYGSKLVKEYKNSAEGIKTFIDDYQEFLPNSLCILEPTGGYEMEILLSLCSSNFAAHRANGRKVKNFIRSYTNGAKNDLLDAKALALYGYERSGSLDLFVPQSARAVELYELIQRRNDLKQILVAEKNRISAPKLDAVKNSISSLIATIAEQIKAITENIDALIEQDEILTRRKEVLLGIPGVGNITANELLILLPELGSLDRRQIASLAGLAPIAKDSGKLKGYRRIGHGRKGVKSILFTAAMAARRSNSALKQFYERLIKNGKKKMVALTALMRKIIVIANARLKDCVIMADGVTA